MDWRQRIDGYCERVGWAFWAEPANAITNGAFVIAGVLLLIYARRRRRLDAPVTFLGGVICVIGVGSFLFHTIATAWAALLDTIPIMVFILGFFTISMQRYFGLSWGKATLAMVAFLAGMIGLAAGLRELIGPDAGGSESYFPALLALIIVGGLLRIRDHPAARSMLIAGGLCALSLVFRTLDQPICQAFPLGTHFLWHLLNASVLGTLMLGLIHHGHTENRPAIAR